MKRLSCLLLIWCLVLPLYAEEAPPRTMERADAYQLLRRGDQARDRREWAKAIEAYQLALDTYRLIGRNVPAWEEDYFNFRQEYCEREIRLIEQQTGRAAEAWLQVGSASARDAQHYRSLYLEMRSDYERLRRQVERLETEVDTLLEMAEIEEERMQAREREWRQREQRRAREEAAQPALDAPDAGTNPEETSRPVPRRERRSLDAPVLRR